jgi:Tol biopolymer transport system component
MKGFFGLFAAGLMATAMAEPFSLVSVRDGFQTPPAGGSGDSRAPLFTPDGRYVLFASTANNLVSIDGSNPLPVVGAQKFNVFERDRTNGITTLISVNLMASGGGNGDSLPTAISDDGRYALFESSASDLVPGDTNGVTDVFLRDAWSNTTVLISISTNGGVGNDVSRGSTLTPDGRYVAFTSAASNLVANDTNGIADVFVRDWQNGMTWLVSAGAQPAILNSPVGSESPDISADGRYVVFYTVATNLVPGVTNSGGEIYVRDLVAATTTWASAGAHVLLGNNASSFNHVLSADGNFVAYEAYTNSSSGAYLATVFRFSMVSGLTDTVYTNAYVPASNLEDFHDLNLTPDGRFIVFIGNTNSISANSVYLWDAQTGINTLVSGDLNGNVPSGSVCDWPAMDPTGRFVAFLSNASGLVTNPVTDNFHLYVADVKTGVTTLVDVDTNGVGVGVSAATIPQLSADGKLVAFEAPDASLVPNDRNHDVDIFVHDLAAGTNELISAHDPALPSASANGSSGLTALSSSADGRWLVFASEADNLLSGITNGFRNIFIHDLKYGTNLLVSVSTNGGIADGVSSEPAMSSDGRFVVFSSAADNLVPGDTNNAQDVFVRALPSGPTMLVSVNSGGSGSGNDLSGSASISATGQYVLFQSQASNLTAGSFSGTYNLFLRDMSAGTTYALTTGGVLFSSFTPDGRMVAFMTGSGSINIWDSQAARKVWTNSVAPQNSAISLSPDGTKIVYFTSTPAALTIWDRLAGTHSQIGLGYGFGSRTGLRFSADGRFLTYAAAPTSSGTNQVYLYDFQAGSGLLVSSAAASGLGPNASSDSPDISADGRYVAYRSFATNILATGDSNNIPDLFLYDSLKGTSSLLSADRLTGGSPDNRSRTPVFSPDGRTLFFQSWASDLVPLDFNHGGDVLALAFLYVSIVPGTAPDIGATLTWPSRPGETYEVQFKDDLGEPSWQQVSGSVVIDGNQASLTDLAPASGQRFYRVLAY